MMVILEINLLLGKLVNNFMVLFMLMFLVVKSWLSLVKKLVLMVVS